MGTVFKTGASALASHGQSLLAVLPMPCEAVVGVSYSAPAGESSAVGSPKPCGQWSPAPYALHAALLAELRMPASLLSPASAVSASAAAADTQRQQVGAVL